MRRRQDFALELLRAHGEHIRLRELGDARGALGADLAAELAVVVCVEVVVGRRVDHRFQEVGFLEALQVVAVFMRRGWSLMG